MRMSSTAIISETRQTTSFLAPIPDPETGDEPFIIDDAWRSYIAYTNIYKETFIVIGAVLWICPPLRRFQKLNEELRDAHFDKPINQIIQERELHKVVSIQMEKSIKDYLQQHLQLTANQDVADMPSNLAKRMEAEVPTWVNRLVNERSPAVMKHFDELSRGIEDIVSSVVMEAHVQFYHDLAESLTRKLEDINKFREGYGGSGKGVQGVTGTKGKDGSDTCLFLATYSTDPGKIPFAFTHPEQCSMLLDRARIFYYMGPPTLIVKAEAILRRLVLRLGSLPESFARVSGKRPSKAQTFNGLASNWAPRASYTFYEQVLNLALNNHKVFENSYIKYHAALSKQEKLTESVNIALEQTSKMITCLTQDINDLVGRLQDTENLIVALTDPVVVSHAVLMKAFGELKDRILNSFQLSVPQLVDALTLLAFSPTKAMTGVQGFDLLFQGFNSVPDIEGRPVNKNLLIGKIKRGEATVKSIKDTLGKDLDGSFKLDDPFGTRLMTTEEELMNFLEAYSTSSFANVINEIKDKFDEFVKAILARNEQAVLYNIQLKLYIDRIESRKDYEKKIRDYKGKEIQANDPDLFIITSYMADIYQSSRSRVMHYLDNLVRSLTFRMLKNYDILHLAFTGTEPDKVPLSITSDVLRSARSRIQDEFGKMVEIWGSEPARFRSNFNDVRGKRIYLSKAELDELLRKRSVRCTRYFCDFSSSDLIQVIVKILVMHKNAIKKNDFSGCCNIRIYRVRFGFTGLKIQGKDLTARVTVTSKHSGDEIIVDRNNLDHKFVHDSITAIYSYDLRSDGSMSVLDNGNIAGAGAMNSGVLPNHSSAVEEKLYRANAVHPWTRPISLPIPGVRTRRLRILVPNFGALQPVRGARRRSRGPLVVCLACMALFFTVMMLSRGRDNRQWTENWPPSTTEQSTLVFRREDLQRIWKWEIASGHYPSSQTIPKQVGLKTAPLNPAVPHMGRASKPSRVPFEERDTETYGVGPKRTYLDIQSVYPNVAYPPRPVPGSVADMDIIMKHCNFSANKVCINTLPSPPAANPSLQYVRDCLEVLRVGGGLDNGRRTRRGNTDDWKYIYTELNATELQHDITLDATSPSPEADTLTKKRGVEWEPPVSLPPALKYRPSSSLEAPCDPENPRVYHMFWTGPFTDKPYLALLSFLYTQNTYIHQHDFPANSPVCRPQFWMWINPGPAASVPNPSAHKDMFAQLKNSPWASPFLHPRFNDVIKFKLWNTTEQLDGVPEIQDEWRSFKTLFNSGGHVISVPSEKKDVLEQSGNDTAAATTTKKGEEEDMLNRTGSKSSSSYDRLSVILSDMARFILCHRFGGIYLDADTIFLRDWEELWGWKGAFAYRWSRLEKYNTAVLKMHKGSALGTFLFRTALKNGLDFHPMSVSLYTKDAFLEPLLLRLPDALFDSAWLNTENYQRDRPPQPYFTEFADFFDTPTQNSAAPQALGFDGFFKGAYSYHFHNFWWKPFDASRNWPDLGPRFKTGEAAARAALEAEKVPKRDYSPITTEHPGDAAQAHVHDDDAEAETKKETEKEDSVDADKRDLDWST
ncbi:hypothetical protein H0H87_002382, partial [Tephrocybe sp. NHM501043]